MKRKGESLGKGGWKKRRLCCNGIDSTMCNTRVCQLPAGL